MLRAGTVIPLVQLFSHGIRMIVQASVYEGAAGCGVIVGTNNTAHILDTAEY